MKKNIVLALLSIIITAGPLAGQVDHGYLIDKYWFYRERLNYYVSNGYDGSMRGEGMVAGIRNKQSSDVISYGDQMVHFGYYIGVLATEYALLTYYGQDATATLHELDIALNCYVRDDECEGRKPWYKYFGYYDGFHMRQDVPVTFIQDHPELNTGLTSADGVSVLDAGSPAWVAHVSANDYLNWDVNPGGTPYPVYQTDAEMKTGSMSQDNAIGLIKGLALVDKCIPEGYYAHEKAKEIADKVITRMWGGGSWIILDPNQEAVPRGANAFFYAVPLTVINMAMGNPMLPSGANAANTNLSWQTMQYFGQGAENNCMTLTMAALCDCWNGSMVGLAGINTTGGCIYQLSGQDNWDTFYLLLWGFLHDKTAANLSMTKVTDQLLAAPCNGPYCYDSLTHNHAPEGWASTYKFEQASDYQNHGKTGSQGNYNGLDYMLLYNLYHLVNLRNGLQPIAFMDLVNRNLSGSLPTCRYAPEIPLAITYGDDSRNAIIDAFKTITSVQVIDNYLHSGYSTTLNENQCPGIGSYDAGNVTYRAGKSIVLKPGFEARSGCYFHAYINPFDCNNLKSSETGNPYDFHNQNEYIKKENPANGTMTNPWNADGMFAEYLAASGTSGDIANEQPFNLTASPNPFSGRTTLYFDPVVSGNIVCTIYNINGIIVFHKEKQAHQGTPVSVELSGSDWPSGTYCCVITAGDKIAKLNLIKQ